MKKQRKKIVCSLLSSTLIWGFSTVALAEEPEELFAMEEVVVTASRMPTKLSETAANVTVVTRNEIEKGNYTNVPEILGQTNIILESNSERMPESAPLINGDHRVLILIDGRRINANTFMNGTQFGTINMNLLPSAKNIERIEIVRGPASALYGSDAAGGVINIITRQATQEDTTVYSEFGNWGLRRYGFTTENKVDGFGYRIAYEHKDQDYFEYKDYKTGQIKRMPNSGIDEDALSLRLDKELSGGRSLTLTFDHDDSRDGSYHHPPEGPYYMPETYKKTKVNNVALTYNWPQGASVDNMFRIYRNDSSYHWYDWGYAAFDTGETERYITDKAFGGEWQQTRRLNEKHTLVNGAEWRESHVKWLAYNIDNTLSNRALFLEDRWKLDDSWIFTSGVRYDRTNTFGGKATSRFSLNRKLDKNSNAYLSWGQVFRTPLVNELYGGGQGSFGNPDLRPETGDTVTVGVNTQLSDDTKIQASVFSSRIKDAIRWAVGETMYDPWVTDNVANEKRHGGEISLTHELSPQWNVSVGYSYVKIKIKEKDELDYHEDPDNAQPQGYRLQVGYNQDKWNAGVTLRGATGRDLKAFASEDYWVVDLNANYQMDRDTRAYLKVYNLANKAYDVRGSYRDTYMASSGYYVPGMFPMPSRYIAFGLERHI
ncbi:Vitamin B12 transporter BtuB [uncultured Sporomusa sp.]|uniref:Vitamin B12 transporter BtuB n=1 Tax=uncultured Sporomusa sp. TaxID=307249 RepID=A0A212LV97_9FIRM|nr:TonB-dependent receptor [uncultured Sporomusa sp.]SCM81448.1 Vitamin B12 transporter BtuB [uncultured Sporomusa sp.]